VGSQIWEESQEMIAENLKFCIANNYRKLVSFAHGVDTLGSEATCGKPQINGTDLRKTSKQPFKEDTE
jgi:hypothetical protein